MLDSLFLKVCNMSFTASYIIVMVLVIRLLIIKAPKIFSYSLWLVVLFRLLCPFSFESAFSIFSITATQDIQPFPDTFRTFSNVGTSGEVAIDTLPLQTLESFAETVQPLFSSILTLVWILGILAMVIYSIIQLVKLKQKLVGASLLKDNIYLADHISSPFVMGFIKPKIYLPSSLSQKEQEYIILHEQTHIKRLDHITRIISFIALSIHWFNPLVWLAFVLSAKDMEMSCDERVMQKVSSDIRADYSQSLLKFSTNRKLIAVSPLAFGEGDTKERVKNVMKYQKPVIWVSVICLVVVGMVAVMLMSNQKEISDKPPTLYAYYEYGVTPMNLGGYSWNGVNVDSIYYTEMNYDEILSYNENKGHRNANIFFSTNNTPSDFNTDNIRGEDTFKIVEMKRFVDDKEEVLSEFDENMILVRLETDNTYLYQFKVEFKDGNYGYYSVKINNNMVLIDENTILTVADYENFSKAIELAKIVIKDTPENKIINYAQPKVELVTFNNAHKIFNEDNELIDINGKTAYQVTFETEEDELIGPIVCYVNPTTGDLTVLGTAPRK